MNCKIISCIGDSLTEGDYGIFGKSGIANVHSENYPYFLQKLTNSEVRNFGYSGFRSIDILNLINSNKIDVTNSDIIFIMLGTNGGQTEEGNSENDLAYKEIVGYCKKKAPYAHVILIAPPYATQNPKWSNCGYINNILNANKFLKAYAPTVNLPLIDLFANENFCEENIEKYQNADGLHFNKEGYKLLANILYNYIKDLINKI